MVRNLTLALIAAVILTVLPTPGIGGGSPTCFGRTLTAPGTSQADSLSGRLDRRNVLMGFAGDDELLGANLRDSICGGEGHDVKLAGGQGDDRLAGNSGRDRLVGGPGSDRILGGWGDDWITSGPGRDHVDGGAGDGDHCLVGALDTVVDCEIDMKGCFGKMVTRPGTVEDDSFDGVVDEHNVMMGGTGDDEIYGANLRDYICGGPGDDPLLTGGEGGDRISGNAGGDTMYGDTGADWVLGRRGDDVITSGPGSDFVDGGPGTNTCLVDPRDTVVNCEL